MLLRLCLHIMNRKWENLALFLSFLGCSLFGFYGRLGREDRLSIPYT